MKRVKFINGREHKENSLNKVANFLLEQDVEIFVDDSRLKSIPSIALPRQDNIDTALTLVKDTIQKLEDFISSCLEEIEE